MIARTTPTDQGADRDRAGDGGRVADEERRTAFLVDRLVEAFADLMAADPEGFRTKFRKMAADPFAFYRGSACVFYADLAEQPDRWADERTGRIWIQGDLHAENFGTYMDGSGVLIFDVNDFDEAFVGPFTWDLKRFAASVVSEISPYEADLDWSELTEPAELAEVIDQLGRAVAKVHCVSDSDIDVAVTDGSAEDGEQPLVDFQTEEAIAAAVGEADDELITDLVEFGLSYGAQARADHARFVEAFRAGAIPGVTSA